MKSFVMILSLALLLMLSSNVLAQVYATYAPVGPVPVTTYYSPAPVLSYGPVVSTSYYAPLPYTAYYAPAPYYVGSPVVVGPVYGWPVVVRPRFYVPGQPVRNVLRAIP